MTLSIKPFKILFYFFCMSRQKCKANEESKVLKYNLIFIIIRCHDLNNLLFLYLLIYLFRCCCCWRCWRWFRWLYINIIVTWIIAIIIVVDVRIYSSTFRTLCINRCNIPRRTLLLLLVLGGLGGFTYYNSYFDYPLKAPFVNNTKGTLIR